jgi:hypothetical protein
MAGFWTLEAVLDVNGGGCADLQFADLHLLAQSDAPEHPMWRELSAFPLPSDAVLPWFVAVSANGISRRLTHSDGYDSAGATLMVEFTVLAKSELNIQNGMTTTNNTGSI